MRPLFFLAVCSTTLFFACAQAGVTDEGILEGEDSGTAPTEDAAGKKDSGGGARDSGADGSTSSDAKNDTTTSDAPADSPIDAPKDSPVDAPKDSPVDAPPDTGTCQTVPPNNLCGVSPQCGCGANMTCDVTNNQTGATSCITAGSKPMGQPCASTGECALGLTCTFDVCRQYCSTPNANCTGSGVGLCFSPEYETGKTTPNRNVCSVTCDLRTPSTACGAANCMWFGGSSLTDCRAAGTRVQDDPCSGTYQCAAGHHCVSYGVCGAFCERWCRIGQAGDCPSGYGCSNSLGANQPIINGVAYGTCG
jgi:hypothetical protein